MTLQYQSGHQTFEADTGSLLKLIISRISKDAHEPNNVGIYMQEEMVNSVNVYILTHDLGYVLLPLLIAGKTSKRCAL